MATALVLDRNRSQSTDYTSIPLIETHKTYKVYLDGTRRVIVYNNSPGEHYVVHPRGGLMRIFPEDEGVLERLK